MATPVPADVTVDKMTGTYSLNKTLSDSPDKTLQLQGVSWIVRSAISMSSVKIHLNLYTDDAGAVHLDMETESTGGMKNTEERTANWEYQEAKDKIFGQVKGKSRFVKMSELTDVDEFLKQGWDKEIQEGNIFESYVESVGNGWVASQLWGFGEKDGVRRHMRKIVVTKGKTTHKMTMYYDWAG